MNEAKVLARVAYEAYQRSKYDGKILQQWDAQPEHWQKDWIAVVQAVSKCITEMQQTAAEASE